MNGALLVLLGNDDEINNPSLEPLKPKKRLTNKLLDVQNELLLDYNQDIDLNLDESNLSKFENNKQKDDVNPLNNIKVILIITFLGSALQSFIFVFILPNNLIWPNNLLTFFIVIGWSMLFNCILFIPSVIKFIVGYFNEALTDYECL